MITYNTRLTERKGETNLPALLTLLEWHRTAFNEAAKIQFGEPACSIVKLHSKLYYNFRQTNPHIPAQVVIRGEQECLSAYRSIKSNKHKISAPIEKKRLGMRLDKRLYSRDNPYSIRITTANGRKEFGLVLYPRLKELIERYPMADPLLYVDDAGFICISLVFKNKTEPVKPKLALGVDLGIRVAAACSDGRVIIDKKYNKEKRKLRYLKRQLQSKGTKSARRHLKAIRRKEANKAHSQTHLIANEILKTDADTIALEDLKGIKAARKAANPHQNQNQISQVPLAELRRIITYKAENTGKTVTLVNPAYTSQTDSLTGKRDGKRQGRRYYTKAALSGAKPGLVYDADLNAARNIGIRSKLPVSLGNLLDGQAHVSVPNSVVPGNRNNTNVCKSPPQG